MASRFSFTSVDRPVISQVNTTPLIDVMLVLLILCVISIPMMTHKVTIQLPGVPPIANAQPSVLRLALAADGALSWNGLPVKLAELPQRLQVVERDPESLLEINANGFARYEDFDRMLAVVKRAGVERIGFVGIDGFANILDRWPVRAESALVRSIWGRGPKRG
jgi:biopolymer transport protein ExbD